MFIEETNFNIKKSLGTNYFIRSGTTKITQIPSMSSPANHVNFTTVYQQLL